jgi:hypothetical protein
MVRFPQKAILPTEMLPVTTQRGLPSYKTLEKTRQSDSIAGITRGKAHPFISVMLVPLSLPSFLCFSTSSILKLGCLHPVACIR